MKRILIDTDVILDFFLDRISFSEDASEIIAMCEKGKLKGFITPAICSNLYYILRKLDTHKNVIEKIAILLSILEVLAMDKNIVLNALESDFKDFEDALQYFSAKKTTNITAIITRNVVDYKHSNIAVLTPDAFLKSL